jgi:hypothetical protein
MAKVLSGEKYMRRKLKEDLGVDINDWGESLKRRLMLARAACEGYFYYV